MAVAHTINTRHQGCYFVSERAFGWQDHEDFTRTWWQHLTRERLNASAQNAFLIDVDDFIGVGGMLRMWFPSRPISRRLGKVLPECMSESLKCD
jgi:hypothetical protein